MDRETSVESILDTFNSMDRPDCIPRVEVQKELALLDCIRTSLERGPMEVDGLDLDYTGMLRRFTFIEQVNEFLRSMTNFLKKEASGIEINASSPETLMDSFNRWLLQFAEVSQQVGKTVSEIAKERDLWKDRYLSLVHTLKNS